MGECVRRASALQTVSGIPQHCYLGSELEPLVFVGAFKSGRSADDVTRQYNMLDPVVKLIEVPCEQIRGEFAVAHYGYHTELVESWLAAIDRPPRSICMDNSYEPGFKHMVDLKPSLTSARIIHTGMDHAKTDSTPDALFRNYDLCMTMSLNRFRESHALAISREERDSSKGNERRLDHRFVVLINKQKGWRIWFIARLHEFGILSSTLYTLAERPHPCYFHSKTHNTKLDECKSTHEMSDEAIEFSRAVSPNILSDKNVNGSFQLPSDFDLKAMIPRGRVHVILESEATSIREGQVLCHWNERLTEKTWDALSFGHAFILVGTFLSLDLVKAHGFKTFSPCINETYATIWDEDLKLQAILDEVKRLHALSDVEYKHLYATCLRPRAHFNYDLIHSREFKHKQAQQRLWAWGISDEPGFDMEDIRRKSDDAALVSRNESLSRCRN